MKDIKVTTEHLLITDKELIDWLEHKVATQGWVTLDRIGDPGEICCPYRVETDKEQLEEWEESVRTVLQLAIYRERNPRL